MSLACLVYASLANNEMTEEDLKGLLSVARSKNEKLEITGLLLYRDGFFAQALEGEKDKIDALFDRISIDGRHRDVTKIYEKSIHERSFPNWSMGYCRIEDHHGLETIEGYCDFMQNATPHFLKSRPSYAQALLENFKADMLF